MADALPTTLLELQRMYEKPAFVQSANSFDGVPTTVEPLKAQKPEKNDAAKARARAISDTALSLGIKEGMASQLYRIRAVVEQRQRALDTIYDFSTVMIRDRVVPAVITESRNLYNQDGDYALRLSGGFYKIESQARFSSTAPNWRGYLSFPSSTTSISEVVSGLIPRDLEEQKIWQLMVTDGWQQGVVQANLMFENAMDRMNRDFLGMLRFHTFVLEGKITMPVIAVEAIPITQSGSTMAVDETLLRITTIPEFNGKITSWSSSIASSPEVNSATVSADAIKP
jgi:defect-in-organelle-trafficking protein DotC